MCRNGHSGNLFRFDLSTVRDTNVYRLWNILDISRSLASPQPDSDSGRLSLPNIFQWIILKSKGSLLLVNGVCQVHETICIFSILYILVYIQSYPSYIHICMHTHANIVRYTFLGTTLLLVTMCDSLNRNGPYRLVCVNAWHIGSSTIRRSSLIGVSMALLDDVCHCGGEIWVLICGQSRPSMADSFCCLQRNM